MGTISQRAIDKVSGPAWNTIRSTFNEISTELLAVSPETFADLTTIYIKYTLSQEAGSPVYAIVWVKSSKNVVVGLALPETDKDACLGPAPKGMAYKGLTGYFTVTAADPVPRKLEILARRAYQHIKSQI